MKTLHTIDVGLLKLVIRSDGGVYLGESARVMNKALRVGSSAAVCSALAEAFREAAEKHRELLGRKEGE